MRRGTLPFLAFTAACSTMAESYARHLESRPAERTELFVSMLEFVSKTIPDSAAVLCVSVTYWGDADSAQDLDTLTLSAVRQRRIHAVGESSCHTSTMRGATDLTGNRDRYHVSLNLMTIVPAASGFLMRVRWFPRDAGQGSDLGCDMSVLLAVQRKGDRWRLTQKSAQSICA